MSEPDLAPKTDAHTAAVERLLRGTYSILAQHGTRQISLRRIARELEVSPSLLVYHFGSHENLLVETIRWSFQGAIASVRTDVVVQTDARQTISRFLDRLFADAETSRERFLIYLDLVQYSARNPSFEGIGDIWREYLTEAFEQMVVTGVESGFFPVADVIGAARRARAIVDGAYLDWLQSEDWKAQFATLREDCETTLTVLLTTAGTGSD